MTDAHKRFDRLRTLPGVVGCLSLDRPLNPSLP